ncbi:exodeoxyribonuclease VII small subunit [Candidatus Nanopelagicales bacterium]|nr:exodeoxyribonuclease VII small subunit [Candidatus Nanopelagicales bacterium]
MSESENFRDTASLSYEEARDELSAIVTRLEEGNASLEQSLKLWERGEALTKRCTEWLDSAQARLTAGQSQEASEPDISPPTQLRVEKQAPPPPPHPAGRQDPSNRPADPPW